MKKADKARWYADLVAERKACHKCKHIGLTNPSEVEKGAYDTQAIGPWTAWRGNLNAHIMVIGQDWGDRTYFRANRGRDNPNNPTNTILTELIEEALCQVRPLSRRAGLRAVYLTNAVLCLKKGNMQTKVLDEWFANCRDFLVQQVRMVNPRVVVTLGQKALDATLQGFGIAPLPLSQAVTVTDGILLSGGCKVFAMYHCGARVLNTHRSEEAQIADWHRLGAYLNRSLTDQLSLIDGRIIPFPR